MRRRRRSLSRWRGDVRLVLAAGLGVALERSLRIALRILWRRVERLERRLRAPSGGGGRGGGTGGPPWQTDDLFPEGAPPPPPGPGGGYETPTPDTYTYPTPAPGPGAPRRHRAQYRPHPAGPRREGAPLPPSAYARLDCPPVVEAGTEFVLVAGLAATPSPGVVGDALKLPPDIVDEYVLSVHVVADGFILAEEEDWRRTILVTAADPYPLFRFRLTAEPQVESTVPRAIRATYAANGQTMGFAVRPLAVVRDLGAAPPTSLLPPAATTVRVPTDEPAPDLTIHVHWPDRSSGRLRWTWESPHDFVTVIDMAPETDIGGEPDRFMRQLVEGVPIQDRHPGTFDLLLGKGHRVADRVPAELWTALAQIHRGMGARPSVLILSEEPYVPWELAVLDEPIDPEAPPFLATQVDLGRWILATERPKSPPVSSKSVADLTVVYGEYSDRSLGGRLEFAEQEAAELEVVYDATPVEASTQPMRSCLRGYPASDVLHFAMHGRFDREGIVHGLIMTDGWVMTPDMVRARRLEHAPFVFLNACQVGQGEELLGDYAGLAEAFLYAGACGVVAPLWAVEDEAAFRLASEFYAGAFTEGRPCAGVLRDVRARFTDETEETTSATYLAYVFFGHPHLSFARSSP